MRHQSPVCSRARSKYFYARAVRVQLHTRVFLKFKSSCTVHTTVEPLLKDTLNKEHLSIKDKLCGPYRTMAIQFYVITSGWNMSIPLCKLLTRQITSVLIAGVPCR